jgi:hypothetical protein
MSGCANSGRSITAHYANEMMMKAEPKGSHLATFDWGDLRALRPSQKNPASQNDFNPF